jgi:hypothetical protein
MIPVMPSEDPDCFVRPIEMTIENTFSQEFQNTDTDMPADHFLGHWWFTELPQGVINSIHYILGGVYQGSIQVKYEKVNFSQRKTPSSTPAAFHHDKQNSPKKPPATGSDCK